MDTLFLARLQFGFTVTFHYLFPPMTIGLSWMMIYIEGLYIKTKDPLYKKMAQFWTRIFSLFFVMGVATGFVLLFAFGNNWSTFSKFVGDVFGSLLAAEGIFAFFMEGGFLGIMLFGWNRVKPTIHYLSTILVSFGATFSATWIVMANSWMQTPSGYKIIGEGANRRAVITNLWEIYFSPSFLDRVCHVLLGCFLMGIFLLISVGAYYLLKGRHLVFARSTMKMGLVAAVIALSLQLISGDSSARLVAKYQPTKFAAMEAVFNTEKSAAFTVLGYVDMENEKVRGIAIPGLLSFLTFHDFNQSVTGLNEVSKEDWPHVPSVFYSYHLMIYCWFGMMFIAVVGLFLWWKKRLERARWYLWGAVVSIAFPYLANMAGWFTAEIGRQPWIVYNVMRVKDGLSRVVSREQVLGSLMMFVVVYALLGSLFVFLLNRKIQHGPEEIGVSSPEDAHYRDRYQVPNQ